MAQHAFDILDSIRSRFLPLLKPLRREFNIDVFANPEKYQIFLSIEKIVADTKVSFEAIEFYKQKIRRGEKLAPLIVVKHPNLVLYAILDGHHRYYAYLELGRKEVECALAGDFSSVFFYLTEHGFFQPNPETAGEMRRPVLIFHKNLQDFLQDFLKDPNKPRKTNREIY